MRLSFTPFLVVALAAIFWTTVIYSGVGESDHITFDTPQTTAVSAVTPDNEADSLRRSLLTRLEFEELNLRLLGVVSFQGDISCYIRQPGQTNQMTYKPGDVIGGYRIDQIQNQAVVFEREGTRLWLMLGDNEDKATAPDGEMDAAPDASAEPDTEATSTPVFTADHDGLDAEDIAQGDNSLEEEAAALAVDLKKAPDHLKSTTDYYETASLIEDGSNTRPRKVAGKVVDVTRSAGLGRYIKIRHDNGFETVYGHLSRQLVKEGQVVHQGDAIGREGNTGISTGPHLHFEIHKNGKPVNPESYIKFR